MSRPPVHLAHSRPRPAPLSPAEAARRWNSAVLASAPSPAQHPEERHAAELQAAFRCGYDSAEETFFTRGWRAGFWCGAVAGILGAALAAVTFARWVLA